MTSPSPPGKSLPPGVAARLDPICDRFEAEWLAGHRPALEEFIDQIDEPDRLFLLRELLALELDYRSRQGEQPTPDDYHARFPSFAELIDGLFREPGALSRGDSHMPPPEANVEQTARVESTRR